MPNWSFYPSARRVRSGVIRCIPMGLLFDLGRVSFQPGVPNWATND